MNDEKISTVFFFPIGWSVSVSYLSLDLIGNTLKECDPNTKIIDLNIEFYKSLLTHSKDYGMISNNKYDLDILSDLRDDKCIHNFDFYLNACNKFDEFFAQYGKLDNTLHIAHNYFRVNELTNNMFSISLNQTLEYIINKKSILLNIFFEKYIFPTVADKTVFIFSVTSITQFITSLYFASYIKNKNKNLKIIFGGNYLSRIYNILIKDTRIFEYVDFLIYGLGENVLPMIYSNFKYLLPPLEEIQNISYKKKELILKNSLCFVDKIKHKSAYTQETSLRSYFLPYKIVPLYLSRGCFWKKCVFCSIPNISGQYSTRKIDEVIVDMKKYYDKGIRHFSFIDEALSPKQLKDVSNAILNNNLNTIYWTALVRFDKEFTTEIFKTAYESGCRRLQFGLESYNSTTLKKMNKGIDFMNIDTILETCMSINISINLFCMIGFPTETYLEALNTINYVFKIVKKGKEKYNVLVTADFSGFLLDIDSNLYKNISSFKIKQNLQSGDNISLYSEYKPTPIWKNKLIREAELKYSKLIYSYYGKSILKDNNTPLYIDEAYWFLKSCF